MTQRRDFRAGLIGYGLAGAVFHGPLIAATDGLRLAAIVTGDETRRAQAARAHPDAAILDTADALWQIASQLDVVVIASPNRTHVPLALKAIDSGLAVVVDKPLAAGTEDAERVIRTAREAGVLLTVFQNRRWDGDFLTVRQILDSGQLGDVVRFESRYERWRPAVKAGWRMHAAPEEAGGLLFDLGSHLIDQAMLLFGPVTHVYAELDRRRQGVEVDDDTFVALHHASGVRSQLSMSVLAAQTAPRFRVLGSRGAFVKHGLDVQEDLLRGGADPRVHGWSREPAHLWGSIGVGDDAQRIETVAGDYPRFYRLLVECLRDGAPPPVDPSDALATLTIIEGARQSAETSEVVRLTSVET
jgi:predicted dehydrogenase